MPRGYPIARLARSLLRGMRRLLQRAGGTPDYVALRMSPHLADDPSFAEDLFRYRSLTGEPLRLLEQYFAERAAELRAENGVCVWFDAANCNCRFYDLRPSTCRVFELDSPGCHLYRRRQAVGVQPSGGPLESSL